MRSNSFKVASVFGLFSAFMALGAASDARAVSIGDWERPVAKAKMDVVRSVEEFAAIKDVELIENRRDGEKDPSGYTLLVAGQPIYFAQTRASQGRCGSRVFIGAPQEAQGRISIRHTHLIVVDRTQARPCIDIPSGAGRWEATLLDSGNEVIQMSGLPEPVYTAQ